MSKLVFNRNGGEADEYGHLQALNRLVSGNIIEGMAVTAQGSPNMTINVGDGTAFIPTGTYPTSYSYHVGIDTTNGENVTIATAPTSNSRIDYIVAYVDLSVTPSTSSPNNPNNMLKLADVQGTVAGSPVVPTLSQIQTTIGASNPFIILAQIAVGTSVTQITSGNITDLRTFCSPINLNLGYNQITSPFTTTTANAFVDVTGLSVTVMAPGGRDLEITAIVPGIKTSGGAGRVLSVAIREGSTALQNFPGNEPVSAFNSPMTVVAHLVAPSAGQHTYKVSIAQDNADTLTFEAGNASTTTTFGPASIVAKAA